MTLALVIAAALGLTLIGTPVFVVISGLTLYLFFTAGIDLSVGSLLALSAVLTAVSSTGRRGCPGGGQPTAEEAFVIECALISPANSIASVKMKISMPSTAFGTSGAGRGSLITRRAALRRGGTARA